MRHSAGARPIGQDHIHVGHKPLPQILTSHEVTGKGMLHPSKVLSADTHAATKGYAYTAGHLQSLHKQTKNQSYHTWTHIDTCVFGRDDVSQFCKHALKAQGLVSSKTRHGEDI